MHLKFPLSRTIRTTEAYMSRALNLIMIVVEDNLSSERQFLLTSSVDTPDWCTLAYR
jgi:hypothetical protein